MSTSESVAVKTEFGAEEFLSVAQKYRANKKIVDATSGYDNVEDAIAGLREAWEAIEKQADHGSGYTPDAALGFGSDNATVIAECLLGKRKTVGAIRTAFGKLGK